MTTALILLAALLWILAGLGLTFSAWLRTARGLQRSDDPDWMLSYVVERAQANSVDHATGLWKDDSDESRGGFLLRILARMFFWPVYLPDSMAVIELHVSWAWKMVRQEAAAGRIGGVVLLGGSDSAELRDLSERAESRIA